MPGQLVPGQAARLLQGAAAESDKDEVLRHLFPEALALGCSLLFLAPIVKMFFLAHDPLLMHFEGESPKLMATFPLVLIAVSYALQRVCWVAPSKWVVLLSLMGPSLLLGFEANHLVIRSMELGQRLGASDCATFEEKYALEKQWQAAMQFRSSCGSSMQSRSYLLQDCPGYALAETSHQWSFLQSVEVDYGCSGWCRRQEPLWTFRTSNSEDSCSSAVASVMTMKIRPTANQILVYSAVALVLAALLLMALTNRSRQGMEQ